MYLAIVIAIYIAKMFYGLYKFVVVKLSSS